MVELIIAIIKGLLPFLKESLLEGGTLREWFKRNLTACLWMVFHLVMLGVTLHLANNLYMQTQRVMTLTGANTILATRMTELDAENKRLHGELATLGHLHDETTGELSRYKAAATLCGVTVTAEGNFQCPRMTTPAGIATKRRRPAPIPPPEPPVVEESDKPTFGERLRSIFTSKKE